MSDGITDAQRGFKYYMWGKAKKDEKAGLDYSEGRYIPDRDRKRRFSVGIEELARTLNDFRRKGCPDEGWLNIIKARLKEASSNSNRNRS